MSNEANPIRTITFTVDGKDFQINLPDSLFLRAKQNPKCNEEKHICGLFNGQKCCLRINFDAGTGSVFEMVPCKKHDDERGLKL